MRREGDRVIAASHFPAVAAMPDAQHRRIAGLTDDEDALGALASVTADDLDTLRDTLRAAMNYQPLEVAAGDVPRDAARIARALGVDWL